MQNFYSFSAKIPLVCVNLRKLCDKLRCFPEKFTQLAQILHDRRLWRSRQISTLNLYTLHCGLLHCEQISLFTCLFCFSIQNLWAFAKGLKLSTFHFLSHEHLLGRSQKCFPRSPTLAGTAEQNGYTITGTKEVRNIRKCVWSPRF